MHDTVDSAPSKSLSPQSAQSPQSSTSGLIPLILGVLRVLLR